MTAIPASVPRSRHLCSVWGNVSSGFIDGGRKVLINRVDSGFFSTLGLRLTRGRFFDSTDRDVVIVSDSFARWHWHGEEAIGKRLTNISPATVIGALGSKCQSRQLRH